MIINKTVIVLVLVALLGITAIGFVIKDPFFSTTEPQILLPVGLYYQGTNSLDLKSDGNYSLYENVSGPLNFNAPYYNGSYLVEKGFVYLKVTDAGGLWTGRTFQIINKTTLLDVLENTKWIKNS
jgi:hypothetical protein